MNADGQDIEISTIRIQTTGKRMMDLFGHFRRSLFYWD